MDFSHTLLIVIAVALIFDFINGFHDAANSIATVVSTKALTPLQAVIWAAAFNFIAYWLFELKVANTVSKIIKPEYITLAGVFSGLLASIIWNLFTWWKGIPSSSSHTLMGGFVGAGIVSAGGFHGVDLSKVMPAIYFIVLAPVIGMVTSFIINIITTNICRNMNPSKVDNVFRRLQLVSSAAYSLGHGGNDAQKTIGVIAAALLSQGLIGDIKHTPTWVAIGCYSAMGLGTMFGGWKIIKTMGQNITKLRPFEGFTANLGGAITLFGTGALGIPASTTHTATGAIIGVGVSKRVSAVRWGVTKDLLVAWLLTIPVTAVLAAGIFWVVSRFI